jgi:hypothetical protein
MKFQQRCGALVVSAMAYTRHRLSEDRGEGVISTAIVVMIVAFLAALMWVGFKAIWGRTETSVNTSINTVGN